MISGHTQEHRTQVSEKVAKLLRQAEDRRGTPEGAIFEEKAFELMAKYGVEAAQLEENADRTVQRKDFQFAGSYTELQYRLLADIANTLHCTPLRYHEYNKRSVKHGIVFGLTQHLERVSMLHSILNPQMVAGAKHYGDTLWTNPAHTKRAKQSWMLGFIETIRFRLDSIETQHEQAFAREGKPGDVVLLDDAEAALNHARNAFPDIQTTTMNNPSSLDPTGFSNGVYSGQNMDLGQTRVQPGRNALTDGS